ncbi:hypothetical protein QFZ40_002974 [Arthrobacter pascens]|uniref:hypothetical protein n=1 Tax=Arthrobacter pascens TaxID=1677 RepID=UPI002787D5C2|nr:hypothetical protein [Arthrobacter pascens]MDQ0635065.1 hypothetical protein [Arthrobacter pascens]
MNDDDDAAREDEVDANPVEDESGVFATLKLDGARFNGGRLPIDALVELQRYRELILEAAKLAWREANPGEEVPADFSSEFDLAVTEIEDGSAVPVMEKTRSAYDSFYDAGRLDVEALFADIVNRNFGVILNDSGQESAAYQESPSVGGDQDGDATPPDEVGPGDEADAESEDEEETTRQSKQRLLSSLASLDAFRDFGSSLREEDSLLLSGTETHEEVCITSETAPRVFRPIFERLALELVETEEEAPERRKYTSTVAGRLIAVNAEARNFKIKTLLFGQVHGRYKEAERLEDLKKVLESNAQAPLIRVTGRMSWLGDHLRQILNVDEVELLEIETEPWSRRIVELASLAKNWHPELGKSPLISFVAIDAAREVLRATQESEISPGIYPGEDGGVIVEWGSPQRVVTLEISPELDFFLFHLDVVSGEAIEFDPEDLSEVIERVGEALS